MLKSPRWDSLLSFSLPSKIRRSWMSPLTYLRVVSRATLLLSSDGSFRRPARFQPWNCPLSSQLMSNMRPNVREHRVDNRSIACGSRLYSAHVNKTLAISGQVSLLLYSLVRSYKSGLRNYSNSSLKPAISLLTINSRKLGGNRIKFEEPTASKLCISATHTLREITSPHAVLWQTQDLQV